MMDLGERERVRMRERVNECMCLKNTERQS